MYRIHGSHPHPPHDVIYPKTRVSYDLLAAQGFRVSQSTVHKRTKLEKNCELFIHMQEWWHKPTSAMNHREPPLANNQSLCSCTHREKKIPIFV